MRKLSDRNLHRLAGLLAVLHSVAIFVSIIFRPWPDPGRWFDPLWFGFATLWFFWPVVLVLHRGRSLLRAAVPLVLAAAVMSRWFSMYSFIGAPALGLPMGCDLHPVSMVRYVSAYVRGRADAKRDVKAGEIAIEVYGFGAGAYVKALEDRYAVKVRVVAGCVVDESLMGHARGYNLVASAELARRSGEHVLDPQSGQPYYKLVEDAETANE